uniref:Spermatogenesis-associated protein 6 N-terminal domain-containing protein n=1 Tax=Periophthalmus magnuspinnatus TaxID=409849 RepID=A0A3B3ZW70_9GOBI
MSRKALKVLVSCPGVRLMACEDIYLSVCFMGQFRQTQCLPAVFPLLFHEKMTFEKIFRYAIDPGDIAVMLEYETVRTELMQLIPPVGMTLAYYTNDARRFLFPEPKLVPPFSGTEQEILMTRSQNFPVSPVYLSSIQCIWISINTHILINLHNAHLNKAILCLIFLTGYYLSKIGILNCNNHL